MPEISPRMRTRLLAIGAAVLIVGLGWWFTHRKGAGSLLPSVPGTPTPPDAGAPSSTTTSTATNSAPSTAPGMPSITDFTSPVTDIGAPTFTSFTPASTPGAPGAPGAPSSTLTTAPAARSAARSKVPSSRQAAPVVPGAPWIDAVPFIGPAAQWSAPILQVAQANPGAIVDAGAQATVAAVPFVGSTLNAAQPIINVWNQILHPVTASKSVLRPLAPAVNPSAAAVINSSQRNVSTQQAHRGPVGAPAHYTPAIPPQRTSAQLQATRARAALN